MNRLDPLEMFLERGLERFGKQGDAVLGPFAVPDQDFVLGEVDVLHPQAQAFHQAQPCTVEKRGHQPFVPGEVR